MSFLSSISSSDRLNRHLQSVTTTLGRNKYYFVEGQFDLAKNIKHIDNYVLLFEITNQVNIFQIDQCGRLWVLDSGMVDIFEKEPKMVCPPQILIFNLKDNTLVGEYLIFKLSLIVVLLLIYVSRFSCYYNKVFHKIRVGY